MSDTENLSSYRRELRERILKTAALFFVQHGIKGVKMDDIAHSLSMSKRTLYELYSNKEVLLLESLKLALEEKSKAVKELIHDKSNVMDIMLLVFKIRIEEFKIVNPLFVDEILKYPQIVKYFEENKQQKLEVMLNFLHRGVEEGYFMPDYDYNMVAEVFNGVEKSIVQNNLLQKYSLEEIFFNMTLVVIRGICTPKGIEILDNFVEQHLKTK